MQTTVCSSCLPLNSNTNTSSHSQPRTPSLASWPLRMQFVRTARSKHKTPPRTLGRKASRRSHFVCSSCVPLNQNTKKTPRTLNGGRRALRRGHLVCSINSLQFVRTAQFKPKLLLALSTEDGGAPGPRVRSPCKLYNCDESVSVWREVL